jgi:hypothetical protein
MDVRGTSSHQGDQLLAAFAGALFALSSAFRRTAASLPSPFFPLIAATIRLAVPHAHEMTACRMLAAFFTLSSIGMVSIRSDGNKFFQSEVANPCSSKADARIVLRPPVASPRTTAISFCPERVALATTL